MILQYDANSKLHLSQFLCSSTPLSLILAALLLAPRRHAHSMLH